MDEIYDPNSAFPFDKLMLSQPTLHVGGTYFMKFHINGNPLYIQSPKCTTKNGISTAGKKMYCDLMIANEHESFIQWMGNLENFSQEYIFKNREKWFETTLEKHDIENSFSSPLKIFKSGKFYSMRASVPTRLGKCVLNIYDEKEIAVNIEQIKENTQMITILEVCGIKCSAKSFQLEIEMKQMMVLKPANLFEKCIITPFRQEDTRSNPMISINPEETPGHHPPIEKTLEKDTVKSHSDSKMYDSEEMPTKVSESIAIKEPDVTLGKTEEKHENEYTTDLLDDPFLKNNTNELTEIDFPLDELPDNDTIHIKKRNHIYYQMYKEAKHKAKIARDLALSSYLEAKRIKNTYMLEDLDDSDESEMDEESDLHFSKNDTEE